MSKSSRDQSVGAEPHLRDQTFSPDPSEARADRALRPAMRARPRDEELVEHSVWDEPSLPPDLAGAPDDRRLTYDRWLSERRAGTGVFKSWSACLALLAFSGPLGVFGAF